MKRCRTIRELRKEIKYLENRWIEWAKQKDLTANRYAKSIAANQMLSIEKQVDWLYGEIERREEEGC